MKKAYRGNFRSDEHFACVYCNIDYHEKRGSRKQ